MESEFGNGWQRYACRGASPPSDGPGDERVDATRRPFAPHGFVEMLRGRERDAEQVLEHGRAVEAAHLEDELLLVGRADAVDVDRLVLAEIGHKLRIGFGTGRGREDHRHVGEHGPLELLRERGNAVRRRPAQPFVPRPAAAVAACEHVHQVGVRRILHAVHEDGDQPAVQLREAGDDLCVPRKAARRLAVRHHKRHHGPRRIARQRQHAAQRAEHVRLPVSRQPPQPLVGLLQRLVRHLFPRGVGERVRELVAERDDVEPVARVEVPQRGRDGFPARPQTIVRNRPRRVQHKYHVFRYDRQRLLHARGHADSKILELRMRRIDPRAQADAHVFRKRLASRHLLVAKDTYGLLLPQDLLFVHARVRRRRGRRWRRRLVFLLVRLGLLLRVRLRRDRQQRRRRAQAGCRRTARSCAASEGRRHRRQSCKSRVHATPGAARIALPGQDRHRSCRTARNARTGSRQQIERRRDIRRMRHAHRLRDYKARQRGRLVRHGWHLDGHDFLTRLPFGWRHRCRFRRGLGFRRRLRDGGRHVRHNRLRGRVGQAIHAVFRFFGVRRRRRRQFVRKVDC